MHSHTFTRHAAVAAGSLTLLTLAACGPAKQAAPAAAPPQVAVVTVHHTDVPMQIQLPGRTTAYLTAQVRARVDGVVQERAFKEGADVKANQLLYQIDPAPYRAALGSAEAVLQKNQATLATANALMDRYKVLVAANAVSKQLYDNAVAAQGQANADVAAAKAALTTARINLGYTSVVSPIAGLSAISQVTQGAYVQASAATLLTTVQQIDPIYVDLQQSSAEGLQLRRQLAEGKLTLDGPQRTKVSLLLEDGTAYKLTGTLEFSGVTVDPNTGSVTLRALFPNPKHILLPGMFVRANVGQGTQQNALLVPVHGVNRNRQGEPTVLVVGADNKVSEKTIQTSAMLNGNWVVDGGLKDGERVIIGGSQKVRAGALVSPVEQAAQAEPTALASSSGAAASSTAASN